MTYQSDYGTKLFFLQPDFMEYTHAKHCTHRCVILILNSILNKIKVKKPCVKRTSGLVIYLGPCHLQRTFHAMFVGMEFPLLDYDIMAYVPYVVPAHP